jgi:hypothetical protein
VRRLAFGALALAAGTLAAPTAHAQQPAAPATQGRPSEQDMFGGPAPAASPTPEAAPGTPPAAAAVATPTPAPGDRDEGLLGAGANAPEHLSDYQAPDNPLTIGGQLYLRLQSSGQQGDDAWTLTAPSLLDAYLDARPNPRVRAFILGRMSFDPTALPGSASSAALAGGSGGALTGGSATGFSSFTTARGPTSILDQMWIRFDILNRVFVTAGKQHVRWGTGRFWQPTDYLHPIKRNPLDVFDARPGTTMLKLHVPWEQRGWNFYGFGIFEDPDRATNTLSQVAAGARAEIVVAGAEVGLDTFLKDGQRPRYGIDVSTGIWELDVYADIGIRSGEDFQVVHRVPDPRVTDPDYGKMCVTTPGGPPVADKNLSSEYALAPLSGVKTQAVGGVNWSHKYNDNDAFTIGGEYFYNQPGYNDPTLYPGLLFNTSNTQALNFFYTGRHYAALFASFPAPYSWNLTTFTLSTLSNLSDMSFISRLDYSYTLLTHITLEAFVGVHYGSPGGEFRLGFDIPTQYTLQQPAPTDGTAPMCTVTPGSRRDPALVDLGVALRVKI